MDVFSPAIDELVDSLPAWTARDVPTSELRILLEVLAQLVDDLSGQMEGIYADQSLSTARDEALRSEWARVYGVENEQLPTVTAYLRAYMQARAADDGSAAALERILLTLLQDPANDAIADTGGFLTFPADGSGLHWNADGSGLHFSAEGKVDIDEQPTDSRFVVNVKQSLVFDRAAFARAVDRGRPADTIPATIVEVA